MDVDARRRRDALALLSDGRWWTLADLVRAIATSRRTVEVILRDVELERDGKRFRARTREPYNASRIADPVAHLVDPATVAAVDTLIADAPRGRKALDHVSATADTAVRRALLVGERFWLPGSQVLCVGDHDLTSVAIAMLHPETDVTVVDIDDRILEFIDAQGLNITTRWTDLRLGLPPSVTASADLAITDPPYTPEGVGLFVARALEGLKADGRVVLAYGVSERTPSLALKVQKAIFDLNLVIEAMWPDFNRYTGAEAIGSAADLYVLRPTAKTLPAVKARVDARIYTRGPQSVESASAAPQTKLAEDADLLVGDWPGLPSVRLSTWLAKPYKNPPDRVAIALPAGMAAALPRVLLASRARRVDVVLGEPARDVFSPVHELAVRGPVIEAVRLPPSDDLMRRIFDSAHANLANTWREGLIATGAAATKNQARALVPPWAHGVSVLELPLHRLRELVQLRR